MRSTLPIFVAAAALGLAALLICVVLSVPYWSDTACLSRYPGGPVPETSTVDQRMSLVPPRLTCLYDSPKRGRIVVRKAPLG